MSIFFLKLKKSPPLHKIGYSAYSYRMRELFLILKKYPLPLIAVLVVAIYKMIPYESAFVEQFYSRGIFQLYRVFWDFLFGWIPVPIIYILLLGLIWYFIQYYRKPSSTGSWLSKAIYIIRPWINCISLLVILFYLLWGFNYKRQDPLQSFLSEETVVMTEQELINEFEAISWRLNDTRQDLGDSVNWQEMSRIGDADFRIDLMAMFSAMNLPTDGAVRARAIYPKGVLLRFSTAGIYLPFVGEGHIDPGLHPITWPFTMMHEMSHGYGYTGEDLCNFWAYLASVNSNDGLVRYSGYMAYWRYLRSNVYRANREAYYEVMSCVSREVKSDLNEIIDYQERYPDIMPMLRDLIYDSYLKSHGISEGLKSYSRLIVLADRWKKKYGNYDLERITHAK